MQHQHERNAEILKNLPDIKTENQFFLCYERKGRSSMAKKGFLKLKYLSKFCSKALQIVQTLTKEIKSTFIIMQYFINVINFLFNRGKTQLESIGKMLKQPMLEYLREGLLPLVFVSMYVTELDRTTSVLS